MNDSPQSRPDGKRKVLPLLVLVFLALVGWLAISRNPAKPADSPAPSTRTTDAPGLAAPSAAPAGGSHPSLAAAATERIVLRPPAMDSAARLSLKPRVPLEKTPPVSPPGHLHRLLVKFSDALKARANREGTLTVSADNPGRISGLRELADALQLRFRRVQSASDASLEALQNRAALRTGQQQPDLAGLVEVLTADPSPQSVRAAADALLPLAAVEYAEIESIDAPPPPPAADIDPPTPSLVSYQTYRGASQGIGVDYVWNNLGIQGDPSLRITDCEYQFNPAHEDLSGLVSLQPGLASMYSLFGDDHGTATMGVLAAGNNGYGVSGSVQNCSVWFYPESSTMSDGYTQYRTATVTAAIAASSPGDVVVLEMQTSGATGGYGPAEYQNSVWNAVKAGTDAGVIVVAAAGNGGSNGGENLDSQAWSYYRNRGDSGAIIVGAGSSSRSRTSYSTYGNRVNLQGWGTGVATTGYGDLAAYGNDHNQEYTSRFNGTSSATSVVASAAALIQSVAIQKRGTRLSPAQIRSLLVATANPQTGDLSKQIGPLPDLTAAVPQLLASEFTNADSISIPDSGNATPYPSTIHVSGVTGIVSAVRVRLNGITHTDPDNLDLFLVGPGGQYAALMSDAGGNANLSSATLMFDDAASTVIPQYSPIVPGRYKPADYGSVPETPPPGAIGTVSTNLTSLAASGANGDWKLYAVDDTTGDSGSIASWSVSFETTPGPTVDFTAATAEATEGDPPVAITASLSAQSAQDVTVPFTVSGSATDPANFTISASTILIPAGQTSASATITLVDDNLIEGDKTITLTMGATSNATPGDIPSETLTIHDNDVELTVISAHGTPPPPSGDNTYNIGSEVTVGIAAMDQEGPTRYVCTGWEGTGSAPASGTDDTVTFPILENSTLTWNWRTDYWLGVQTSDGGGSVDHASDWETEGSQVTLDAHPDPDHIFTGWTVTPGAICAGDPSSPEITVQVAGPVTATANFAIAPPPTFADWAAAQNLTGDAALPSATPAADGIPNLLKYAFHIDSPTDPIALLPDTGTAGLPSFTVDSSGETPVIRLQYLRRTNSVLTYTPMQMDDPASGSRVPMDGTITTTDLDADWQRVIIEKPYDPLTPLQFFTVQVTLPDP